MTQSKKEIIIILSVFVVAAVIMAGILIFWKSGEKNKFFTRTETDKSIQKDNQQKTSEKKEKIDCEDLKGNWLFFKDKDTSLSFCYPGDWGEPMFNEIKVDPEKRKGTKYNLHFLQPNSKQNYPLFSYSTLDYKRLDIENYSPEIDWKKLDLSKSEKELNEIFPTSAKFSLKKVKYNNLEGLKVFREIKEPFSGKKIRRFIYFFPKVKINDSLYNFRLVCLPEQEEKVEILLKSLEF